MNNIQESYNINSEEAIRMREYERSLRYSKTAIVMSLLSIGYLIISIVVPQLELPGIISRTVNWIGIVMIFIVPLISVFLATLGFQNKANHMRSPALALSIVSLTVVVLTVILWILAMFKLLFGVFGIFGRLLKDWMNIG